MEILMNTKRDTLTNKLFSLLANSNAKNTDNNPSNEERNYAKHILKETLTSISLLQSSNQKQTHNKFILNEVIKLNEDNHAKNQTQMLLDETLQSRKDLTLLTYGSLVGEINDVDEIKIYLDFINKTLEKLNDVESRLVYYESLGNCRHSPRAFHLLESHLFKNTNPLDEFHILRAMSNFNQQNLFISNKRLLEHLLTSIFLNRTNAIVAANRIQEELKLEALNLILTKPFEFDEEHLKMKLILMEISDRTNKLTREFRHFAKKLIKSKSKLIEATSKELFEKKDFFEYLSYRFDAANENANSNVLLDQKINGNKQPRDEKEMNQTIAFNLKQFMSDESFLRLLDFSVAYYTNEKKNDKHLDLIRVCFFFILRIRTKKYLRIIRLFTVKPLLYH
jgi:hypothetical protein